MHDEIVGLILPVLEVLDVDETVSLTNYRDKPLTLYLVTQNSRTEEEALAETTSRGGYMNGTILHLSNPKPSPSELKHVLADLSPF